MNTTNIEDSLSQAWGEDIASEGSLIGLRDTGRDLLTIKRILEWHALDIKSVDAAFSEAIRNFSTHLYWRCDGHAWKAVRFFLANKTYDAFCSVFISGSKIAIRLYEANYASYTVSSVSDSSYSVESELPLISSFAEKSKTNSQSVGSEKLIRLWNGRIYDSLEMIAKVRQLSNLNIIHADRLVVLEKAPLLNALDAMGDHATLVFEPEHPETFDARISPSSHYAQTINYPSRRWNVFSSEVENLARSIARTCSPSYGKFDAPAIFVSIDLEKRVFENQKTALKGALQGISAEIGKICVVINGMTGPDGGAGDGFMADVRKVEEEIVAAIIPIEATVDIINMFGWSLREKICATSGCDFFIAPKGNASLIPMMLGKPGVYYSSKTSMNTPGIFNRLSGDHVEVPGSFIEEIEDDLAIRKVAFGLDDGTRVSYRISESDFIKFVVEHFRQTALKDLGSEK